MPQVPTYGQQQVEERALPGVRQSSIASPSLLSGNAAQTQQLGQSVMQAGGMANEIAIKMQERENADMIFRAETSLKDNYLKFEQQTRNRKGVDAWGVLPDTEKFFAEQGKAHSEMLQNDVQRQLFDKTFQRMRQSAMGSAAEYESTERRRSLYESASASIVGSINIAASAAANGQLKPASGEVSTDAEGNPVVTVGRDPMTGIKSDILKRVQVMADLNGWSPERKQMEEANNLTNLHKQVIQALADKDPAGARKYFEANKAEINGSELDTIGKVVKMGGLRETAQSFADTAVAGGMGQAQALAEARKKYTGEEEVAVVQELHARYSEAIQLREQGQKTAADQAWKIYAQTGSTANIPSSLFASMDGRDVEALRTHALNKAAGVGTKTDSGTYYDLRQLAANDPNAFRALDLRKFVNHLSPSDFQEFVKLQTDPMKHADAATLSQQLSDVHDQMNWGAGDRQKKGAFDKATTDAINTEQQRLGKQLDYNQRQSIIDKMAIQGKVPGSGWFSDSKTFYEVAGGPNAAKFVPTPTKEDKQAITEKFKAKNRREPTDAEVDRIYKTWKGF